VTCGNENGSSWSCPHACCPGGQNAPGQCC
jgi:hypothetical protein